MGVHSDVREDHSLKSVDRSSVVRNTVDQTKRHKGHEGAETRCPSPGKKRTGTKFFLGIFHFTGL